jgi:predicted ribosome quality control (RQC) complex YloA/Tae2 family protein
MEREKIELYKKVIEKYQNFTQWILRHTPEIKESERGLNFLNDIDWTEHKIREAESVTESSEVKEVNFMQSRDLTDEEWLKLPKEEILQLYKNCYNQLKTYINRSSEVKEVTDEEMNEEANRYGKLAKEYFHGAEKDASLDFLRGANWMRSKTQPAQSLTDEQIEKWVKENEKSV